MSVKRMHSIKSKIMALSIVPIIAVSIILSTYNAMTSYNSMYNEVHNELSEMCTSIYEIIENEPYEIINHGSADIFDGICRRTGVDITIFSGTKRHITTIKDENGRRAVGTDAAETVIDMVYKKGKEFYSDDVEVNGSNYFGYYMPIKDESGKVIGMTFAGKSRKTVIDNIFHVTLRSIIISFVITVIAAFISILISSRMAKALIARQDEIGDMGRSALMLRDKLEKLISTDPLTGLYNRRSCNHRLEEMKKNADSKGARFFIAIGDIDFFKQFNDKFGHACGDLVLKDISAILKKHIKGQGIVSRWGGEEFLIAFGDFASSNQQSYSSVTEVMNGIEADLHAYRCGYNGEKEPVTMTFGLEEYKVGMDLDELINNADAKLYYGKNHGRNRIVYVIPDEKTAT